MTGITDFITTRRWDDIILVWFVLIDDAYQALERRYGPRRHRGPQPRMSDSEVLTLGVLIDTWFHGAEARGLAFFRQYYRPFFPHLTPSNGHFNRRRQQLSLIQEQLRQQLQAQWGLLDPSDPVRLIDSAPVPICNYARARRNTTARGLEYCGVLQSRRARFYGFRVHALTARNHAVVSWLLAPAARHDSQVMPDK